LILRGIAGQSITIGINRNGQPVSSAGKPDLSSESIEQRFTFAVVAELADAPA
jgi:hypothetical protein